MNTRCAALLCALVASLGACSTLTATPGGVIAWPDAETAALLLGLVSPP